MVKLGVFCAAAALAALGDASVRDGALAETTFSVQSVFARGEAEAIDDRCSTARDFAKRAAKGTDGIDPSDAIDGERAFLQCLRLPRLNPDIEDMRYLVLGAAAAAYLAATKTDGVTSVVLLHQADDMAASLGAQSPDRPWTEVTERLGQSKDAAGAPTEHGSGANGPVHYETVVQRNLFGGSHALKYSDVATSLEDAITKTLSADTAPVSPASSPTP